MPESVHLKKRSSLNLNCYLNLSQALATSKGDVPHNIVVPILIVLNMVGNNAMCVSSAVQNGIFLETVLRRSLYS